MGKVVTVERPAERIALVTIRRAEARNAINAEVTVAMADVVARLEADEGVWAVVLTGEGPRAFCAGADLKEVSAGGMSRLIHPRSGFGAFVNAVRHKPWIAAVNGFAVAGGFEIALACDLIVASNDASFGLPEVKRGLIAAAGGAYRLPRHLPRALAFELIATGDTMPARRAYELGMVNAVVPKRDVIDAAISLAGRICANAPIAVRESLGLARRAFEETDHALSHASLSAQDRVMITQDFREGPLAFIEKRAPNWTGR